MTDTSRTGPVLATLVAANFVIGMAAFMVIGLLVPVAEDLRLTSAEAGWMMTAYAISYALLSPLLVALTGQIGRRRIIAIGFLVFTLGVALCALAPTAALLFAGRVLAAAGAGLVTPVGASVAAGLSPPERRARALALVFSGVTLAQVFGVPAGGWLAYTYGWRSAFWVVVALALPTLWLIWTRVPAGLSFAPVSLRDLGATLRNGPRMLAVGFTATFLGAIYVPYTFLGPLLTETVGFARDGISLALILFGVGAVLGNLLGGIASDRIGPTRTLAVLTLAQALIMPSFSLLPLPVWLVLGLLVLWPIFGFSFMAAQQARLVALAPDQAPVLLSLNAAAIYAGAAIGSAIGGSVLSGFGLLSLGMTGGALALLSLIILLVAERALPVPRGT